MIADGGSSGPVATVLASSAGREESLIPLRMQRMAESPFAFLSGACPVMAGDLSRTLISGPHVMIEAALKQVGIQIGNMFRAAVKKVLAKAQRTHNDTLLAKVARRQADGGWRFVVDTPILTSLDGATRQKVIASLVEYSESLSPEYRFMLHRYSVADVCHRLVGVGSVSQRAYLVLLFGNGDEVPLFLQVKEAVTPAHAPYLPPVAFRINHEGRRVVLAQRGMQSLGDPLLGYTTIDGRYSFVRQMTNLKASMPVEFLTGEPFEF